MLSRDAQAPSGWVERWAGLVPAGGRVLDLAAGSGRNGRLFRRRGHPVTFVDRDVAALAGLAGDADAEIIAADLEGGPWPFAGRAFAGVIGVNYLWRPLFPMLFDTIGPGGALIWDTFAVGNEAHGRPRNPDFLLRDGELLDLVHGRLSVRGYEMGPVGDPPTSVRQRIAAVRSA